MRNEIIRAAKANKETVAEYLWAAHELRKGTRPWHPAPVPVGEVIPPAAHRSAPQEHARTTAELSLVELFDIICKFAATEPAAGNKALLQEARSVLYARLRDARENRPQQSPIALPGN